MARVQGRVTYNGQPLANATVTFIAPGAARLSFGTTNDQGEFTLTTYDNNDGALLGENVVTVVEGSAAPEQAAAGVPDPDSYFKQLQEAEKRPKTLPQRYADAGTSDLRVNVVVGENRPLIECRD